MKLFEARADAEAHPGQWWPFDPDHEPPRGEYDPRANGNADRVSVLIRPLPQDKAEQIDRDVFGHLPLAGRRRRRTSQTKAAEMFAEAQRIKACWAMRDTTNGEIGVADEQMAAKVGKAVGRDVKVGDTVLVDGHWNDELKIELFRWNRDAYDRVVDLMLRTTREEAAEERGKDES